jgi:hypothetical protein
MKRIFIILLLILGLGSPILAQDFTASVSENPVAVGGQFQLTFSLNGNGGRFQPPSLNDFYVLSGPNQSNSMHISNGSMQQTISFSYILQAKAEGTFKIGPASIEAGGKKLQSAPLSIRVVKGNSSSSRGQQQGSGSQPAQDMGDNLFLRVSLNKSSAYQGEEVIATYKIYFRVSVVNYGVDKLPALNGFWTQDLDMPKQPAIYKENVDGVQYNVAEIRKVIMYPQQSGMLELEPLEVQAVVRQQVKRKSNPNDIFDQLFSDHFGSSIQDVTYTIKSNTARLTVKELPSAGKPAGYGGAVGRFSMESSLDKSETKANDPVTLKVRIAGRGNIKLLEAPVISFPPDIESYDPKSTDQISTGAAGISGTRTFEYLLIPRNPGEYKIDPFSFSYFDLDKKEYVTLSSPEFRIKVARGAGGGASSSAISGVSKEDVQMLGKDIRYIKAQEPGWREKGKFFTGSPLFYTLLGSPLLAFVLFLGYYRKNRKLSSNVALMKSRKATKVAKKRLAAANAFLQQNRKSEYYDEIGKALWGYVSDRLGIPTSRLSRDSAAEMLQKHGIKEELINKFIQTLDSAEFARFGPGGSTEMQSMYDHTIELISKIEEEIK